VFLEVKRYFHAVLRCLFVLSVLSVIPAIAGPDDDFVEVYQLIQQTDAQREAGQVVTARAGYQRAQELLRTLKRGYPQWNERVVAFRLRYVAEKLESLPESTGFLTSPVLGGSPTGTSAEPANEVLTHFNALNNEIGNLRTEKERLEAKLREALTAQPAPIDPKELQAAVERITQLQATNKALLSRIETQQVERKNLVEKVLLEESQQALMAVNQQLSGQREKSVEIERLRNLAEGELRRLREVEVKGLKTENSSLKSQVYALQSETERGQQIANLTERLATLQAKFQETKQINDSLVADRDKLQQQFEDLRARQSEEGIIRVKQLETDLALARAESERHASLVTQFETKLAAESVSRTRLQTENQNLVARVQALTEQAAGIKVLQTQLSAEKEERAELEAQLRTTEEQLTAVTAVGQATEGGGAADPKEAGSFPDPAMVAQIQILTVETTRLRDALREGRARQTELATLLTDAQATSSRLQTEKLGLMKALKDLQTIPTQRQLAQSDRTIKSLEERILTLEKERDKLVQKLTQMSEKSKFGIQLARRARLGNPREDAQRFRESQN